MFLILFFLSHFLHWSSLTWLYINDFHCTFFNICQRSGIFLSVLFLYAFVPQTHPSSVPPYKRTFCTKLTINRLEHLEHWWMMVSLFFLESKVLSGKSDSDNVAFSPNAELELNLSMWDFRFDFGNGSCSFLSQPWYSNPKFQIKRQQKFFFFLHSYFLVEVYRKMKDWTIWPDFMQTLFCLQVSISTTPE